MVQLANHPPLRHVWSAPPGLHRHSILAARVCHRAASNRQKPNNLFWDVLQLLPRLFFHDCSLLSLHLVPSSQGRLRHPLRFLDSPLHSESRHWLYPLGHLRQQSRLVQPFSHRCKYSCFHWCWGYDNLQDHDRTSNVDWHSGRLRLRNRHWYATNQHCRPDCSR